MDKKYTWLNAAKKRHLRTLAVILSICVLFTTYPDILATLSIFAAEESEQSKARYVSGFTALPEEIREQSVPVGTGLEELSLPGTLEAVVVTEQSSENTEDKTDGSMQIGRAHV